MICPYCKAEGEKSRVTYRGGFTTLVYYPPSYDEDGNRIPEPNQTTMRYSCSRGHNFTNKDVERQQNK